MDEEYRPSSGIKRVMEDVDLLIMGETIGGSRIFGDRSRKLSKKLNEPKRSVE